MKNYLIISCITFLVACSGIEDEKGKELNAREKAYQLRQDSAISASAAENFLIQESLGPYLLSIQMESEMLKVGQNNPIKVSIKNLKAEKIELAVIEKEASIKKGAAEHYYDLNVKEDAKKVTMVIHLKDTLNFEKIFLHELDFKTNYE